MKLVFLTWDAIDDNEGTVCDTEGGCDFGWEVNVTGGVDQVDQETLAVLLLLLLHELQVGVGHLEVHGNGAEGRETPIILYCHPNNFEQN